MRRQVVLVGDATVGKTHLLSRYVKGSTHRLWLLLTICLFRVLRYAAEGSDGHDWCRVCHTLLECRAQMSAASFQCCRVSSSASGTIPLAVGGTVKASKHRVICRPDVGRVFRRRFGTPQGKRDTEPSPAESPTDMLGLRGCVKTFSWMLHLRLTLPSCCGSTLGLCTLHECRAHARDFRHRPRPPFQQSPPPHNCQDVTRNATFQNCLHPKPY